MENITNTDVIWTIAGIVMWSIICMLNMFLLIRFDIRHKDVFQNKDDKEK